MAENAVIKMAEIERLIAVFEYAPTFPTQQPSIIFVSSLIHLAVAQRKALTREAVATLNIGATDARNK